MVQDIKIRLSVDGAQQSQAGINSVANSLGQLDTRAKLTGQQTAQLSAQVQDFLVQVQAGGSPVTALLQQGSQLSAVFGGTGNALKALGTLITPTTLLVGGLAAGVGALALAYKQGSAEDDAFRRGLVLSGNIAGTTSGQLRQLAKSQADVVGTQAQAAAVIAQLAASGSAASGVLGQATSAAVAFERAGGGAADEVAKKFIELGRAPLATLVKLNEAENFLTASLYQQVKALEDQGNQAEAAAVAQRAYAETVQARAAQLEQGLGTLERAWRGVKDAAGGAWDSMLNVGRAGTTETRIADVEQRLQSARTGIYSRDKVPGLETELEGLRRAAFLEQERAAAVGLRASQEKATVTFLAEGDKYLDRQAQKQREIAKARELAAGSGGQITESDLAARIQAINEKYKERSTEADKAARAELRLVEAGQAVMADAAGRLQVMTLESELQRKLTDGERFAIKVMEDLRDGKIKLTQAERVALAGTLETIITQERATVAMANAAKAARELQAARAAESAGIEQSLARDAAAAAQVVKGIEGRIAALQAETQAQDLAKAQNVSLAAAVELVTVARLREFQAQNTRDGSVAAARVQAEIDARERLAKQLDAQSLRQQVEDFLNPAGATAFGDALTRAFDSAGSALAKLTNALTDYATKQQQVSELLKRNQDGQGGVKDLQVQNALIDKQGKLQVEAYASMANAAKGFFSENSKGYKALEALETGFRAMQMANALQVAATKILGLETVTAALVAEETKRSVAQEAFRAAELSADAAAAAASIAQSQAIGQASAAPAIAKEGSISGLYGAIAMAAVLAALGFATGSFGGQGSDPAAEVAKRQAATGTGTVLGDASAKTESLVRAMEHLEDTARIDLQYSSGMLRALQSIDASMSGLASLIVRTAGGGLTTGKNLGIFEGTLAENKGDALFRGTLIDSAFRNDPLLGGVVRDLQSLWGKTTQQVTDSGLSLNASVADLMAGRGVRQYADVSTTTSSWFGLKKSTTTDTVFAELESTISAQFGLIFKNIGASLQDAAGALGRDTAGLGTAVADYVVDISKLSLKDLKGSELQEAIAAAIGAESDKIAAAALPGLEAFQVIGEGYFETVVRVASGVEEASAALANLGVSAVSYTDVLLKQGDVAAEITRQSIVNYETMGSRLSSVGAIINTLDGSASELAETYAALVDVRDAMQGVGLSSDLLTRTLIGRAGGLDNLASSLDSYLDGFFTQQEQLAAQTAQLGLEFARVGQVLPTSRAEYRELIDTLAASGSDALGPVLALANSFDTLQTKAEDAANKRQDLEVQLLRLQGNETGALAIERARELEALRAIDATLVPLQLKIYELTDAMASMGEQSTITASSLLKSYDLFLQGQQQAADATKLNNMYQAITLDELLANASPSMRDMYEQTGQVPDFYVAALQNTIIGRKLYEERELTKGLDFNAKQGSQLLSDGTGNTSAQNAANEYARQQLAATQDLIRRLDSVEDALSKYTESLLFGDLSTLTPQQQRDQALAIVESLRAQANAGDLAALEAAQQAVETFLRASRTFNGADGLYGRDFDFGRAVIDELRLVAERIESATAAAGLATVDAVQQGNEITAQQVAYQALDRARTAFGG